MKKQKKRTKRKEYAWTVRFPRYGLCLATEATRAQIVERYRAEGHDPATLDIVRVELREVR